MGLLEWIKGTKKRQIIMGEERRMKLLREKEMIAQRELREKRIRKH